LLSWAFCRLEAETGNPKWIGDPTPSIVSTEAELDELEPRRSSGSFRNTAGRVRRNLA
jgi:hypothetical protein